MAYAASNYLEDKLLRHTYKNQPYPSPAAVYQALFTSNPGEAGIGAEVYGSGYVRQRVFFDAPVTQADGSSACINNTLINYGAALSDWNAITHTAIVDAVTGGNILYYGELSDSKIVRSGDTFQIQIGALKVIAGNGSASSYLQESWLNHILRGIPFPSPTTVCLGIRDKFSNEPTASEYIRQTLQFDDPIIQADERMLIKNINEPLFPSALSAWGDMTSNILCDSITAGNILNEADMLYTQSMGINDVLKVPAGTIKVSID